MTTSDCRSQLDLVVRISVTLFCLLRNELQGAPYMANLWQIVILWQPAVP